MTIVLLISLTLNATIGAIAISFGLENKRLRKAISPFDHDGDGKPGGSRKRAF